MSFPNKIGVYLDWRTQEIGVAAALSDDRALMDAYRSGDVYHTLAMICGLTQITTENVGRPKTRQCGNE